MTARVIREIGADILGLVEVEDRPAYSGSTVICSVDCTGM